MRQAALETAHLPEYHERLVIVKLAASAFALRMAVGSSEGVALSVGLEAIQTLERSGRIKRVIPLAQETVQFSRPSHAATETLARVAAQQPGAPGAGIALLELTSEKDLPDLQRRLGDDTSIEFVARVPVRYLAVRTGTAAPLPPMLMWNALRIRLSEARGLSGFKEATEVKVAVLDSGVDVEHPDLQSRVRQYAYDHPFFPGSLSDRDIVGHGTHVAGIIAARGQNVGTEGICQCALHVCKVFSDDTCFHPWAGAFIYVVDPVLYLQALRYCLDEKMEVLNLSLGGRGKPDPYELELFRLLLTTDTTVVAAIGNERQAGSPTYYPAAIEGVIAVAPPRSTIPWPTFQAADLTFRCVRREWRYGLPCLRIRAKRISGCLRARGPMGRG